MKKIFIVLITLLVFGVPGQAQETKDFQTTRVIRGAVIDKKGNPLPGATVRATGGAEYVTTDADGSFSIEVPIWLESLTASYPGLRNNKMEITAYDTMIFKLNSAKNTFGFVDLMFANVWQVKPTGSYNGMIQQLGIMGGAYRKWGGYAKVMMGFHGSKIGNYEGSKTVKAFPTVTGGVIKPLKSCFNIFGGLGLARNYDFFVLPPYNSLRKDEDLALAIEGGTMYKWKKMNALLGLTYVTRSVNSSFSKHNNGNLSIFVGIGMNI